MLRTAIARTLVIRFVQSSSIPHLQTFSAEKPGHVFSARWLTTPPQITVSSHLPIEKYHKISDATMDSLLESLEALVDSIADKHCEVEYSSGVLTLSLGSKGIYVINKQPPNKQIWLSSPVSGPKRYDYVEGTNSWTYSRDGNSLGTLLREELSSLLGTSVQIELN